VVSEERNYAAEAVAIVSGTTSLLPEPAHLQALAAQMESVLKEHRLLTEMLAAIMVDTGQQQIYLPAEHLDRVRRHGVNVQITQNPKNAPGAVIVDLTRRPLAAPAGMAKARLN
jgi:hypothetical protein